MLVYRLYEFSIHNNSFNIHNNYLICITIVHEIRCITNSLIYIITSLMHIIKSVSTTVSIIIICIEG
jgi:hypothetical protein